MPYDDPDPTDPMDLQGMILETDEDVNEEMAECFAMEYMRLGYPSGRILALFQLPHYVGPYRAWVELGPERVEAIISECALLWNGRRTGNAVRRDEEGNIIP